MIHFVMVGAFSGHKPRFFPIKSPVDVIIITIRQGF